MYVLCCSFFSVAGSMLAHLHELQSENRTMQSRIMELASQREFYIAINTKLHQTLTEHNLARLPNGVQPIATGGGVGGNNGVQPQPQPQAMAAISSGPALPPGGEGMSGNVYEEDSQMQESGALESGDGSLVVDADDERMSVSSTAIPKEDQDSLLQAHFSSMQRTSGGRRAKSGSGSSSRHSGLQEGLDSDPMLSSVAVPPSQHSSGRTYGGHSHHVHDHVNSNAVSPLPHTRDGQSHHHQDQERLSGLLSSSHQVVENSGRLAAPPSNEGGTPSLNEVTRVTPAVQGPIASFGSLPNDTSPMLSSTVGHPQGSNNNVYFNSSSS